MLGLASPVDGRDAERVQLAAIAGLVPPPQDDSRDFGHTHLFLEEDEIGRAHV